MSEYTATMNKAQNRVLGGVKQVEDLVVTGVATAAQAVGDVIPELPKSTWISRFPAPAELVNAYFSFAQGLLETNHRYALDIVDALRPVTTKFLPASMTRKATATRKTAKAA
jgi:hypothetical protein